LTAYFLTEARLVLAQQFASDRKSSNYQATNGKPIPIKVGPSMWTIKGKRKVKQLLQLRANLQEILGISSGVTSDYRDSARFHPLAKEI
jgi:hypothetical protein